MASFPPSERAHPNPAVEVSFDGSVVVLSLKGRLDGTAGSTLVEVARAASAGDVSRLDVDLRAVTSFDRSGAASLVACREVGAALAEGLHYRTGQGPGRQALLAAYATS